MLESPKDKMIKTSPRKKAVKNGHEVEIIPSEEKEEVSDKEKKQLQVVETAFINKTPATSGIDLFNKMSRQQRELIKRTIAKGATDDELALFFNVCVGTNLNPFLRQVHFVKRWDNKLGREVGSIQVGIDGFRSIAESGGQYAGSDDAVFRDEEMYSFEIGKIKEGKDVPGSATVTVYKLMGNTRYPFTATARWSEYYPGHKQGFMWFKMPYGQLAKCAEALALRKAFPKLLSGIYEPAEMDQAGSPQLTAFDTALKFISKAMVVADLKIIKEKIVLSEKYDQEQKITLQDAIDERIFQLESNEK